MILQQQGFSNIFSDDETFDKIYPRRIQAKAARHWTPLKVARCAAEFLVPSDGMHVLDIGSGVGKFCLAAAQHRPNGLFYGVEQRKDLVDYANICGSKLNLYNVFFIHGNFTQLDFRQFDHFYFYNSFYENINGMEKIDNTIEHSPALYNYYNRYLYKQLEEKPNGTRIATFHSLEEEIPSCYYVVKSKFDGLLKFWVKV
jgi:SAM-dependent methyltransferase